MENIISSLSPVAIDVILGILILLVACINAKAGFFHSVMKFVVIILAIAIGFIGSNMLYKQVSEFVWKEYGPMIEEKFDKRVEDAQTGATNAADIFKDVWNDTISGFGVEKLDSFKIKDSDVDFGDTETVQKLKVYTLAKSKLVCDRVCQMGTFFIITALALLVLTIIKNILDKVANFSVLGWVNHLLGFVFGAIEMIVILLVIIRFAGLLNIQFFSNLSEGTVLLKWLVGGNVADAVNIIRNFTIDDLKNIKLEDLTTVDFKNVGEQVEKLVDSINISGAVEKVQEVIK